MSVHIVVSFVVPARYDRPWPLPVLSPYSWAGLGQGSIHGLVQDQVLGAKNTNYPFAGIYQCDSLTIGDNVEVTSSNISHLVIKVNGTLTLGRSAAIRVRNGFYPNAPALALTNFTTDNLQTLGLDVGGFRVYTNAFGEGGAGGSGQSAILTCCTFGANQMYFGAAGYGGYGYGANSGGGGNGGAGGSATVYSGGFPVLVAL